LLSVVCSYKPPLSLYALRSHLAELNDDFDVVGFSLQSLFEILRFFTARDQAGQRAEALAWAERYLALAPGDPQAQRLVAELRARR